jgi:hypothetical protein
MVHIYVIRDQWLKFVEQWIILRYSTNVSKSTTFIGFFLVKKSRLFLKFCSQNAIKMAKRILINFVNNLFCCMKLGTSVQPSCTDVLPKQLRKQSLETYKTIRKRF